MIYFSKIVFLGSKQVVIDENYFFYFKMAAWSQILQIVGNSTVFYLSFDTHDSPGSVFIWKSKFTIGFGNVGKIRVKCPCVICDWLLSSIANTVQIQPNQDRLALLFIKEIANRSHDFDLFPRTGKELEVKMLRFTPASFCSLFLSSVMLLQKLIQLIVAHNLTTPFVTPFLLPLFPIYFSLT